MNSMGDNSDWNHMCNVFMQDRITIEYWEKCIYMYISLGVKERMGDDIFSNCIKRCKT